MKTIKRLVAIALALLMILGSVSVASAAWDVNSSEGKTLSITTEIFRKVNDEWAKTDKVKQGEEVKARIYLNTDYYTNTGNLLFFYNNDFFEDSFGAAKQTLTVNPFYAEKPYGISGTFVGQDASPVEDYVLGYGKIDEDFADSHDFVYISYQFESGATNQKLSDSQWIFEIPLTVKADAANGTGVGDFFAVEATTRSTDFKKGYINIPKGPYDGTQTTITSMSNWDAILDYESNPVTLYTNLVSVSFDAGTYGEFDDGSSVYRIEGNEGDKLEVPEPTRTNFKFVGWIVKGEDESTAASVTKFPSAATEYEAVWESTTASSDTLDFVTKFYRLDPETNEWVYTEKVKRGETVKARLFVDTSFYTNAGNIIVFYDKDFFDDGYEYNSKEELVVNDDPQSTAALYNMAGEFTKVPSDGNAVKNLVNRGYITSEFAESHEAITLRFEFEENKNKQINGNYWLAEFTFTVSDEAEGEGEMVVDTKTIKNSGDGVYAYINLPRGEKDGAKETNESMYFWDVNPTSKSYPVTLDSSITLLANGGTFDAENEDEFVIEGYIGDAVDYSTVPVLSRDGYTFKGWVDASIENPTEADIVDLSVVASEIPYEAAAYKAFWINDVEITFVINVEENISYNKIVSAGAPFEPVEDPVREGHRFLGWTTDEKLGKITGLDEFYPTTNTTYYAVFDEITYKVNYYVLNDTTKKFDLVTEGFLSYGDVISSVPASYVVPEGYTLSKAYTDVTLSTEFVKGTTMGIEEVNLYYSLDLGTFDAVFMVDGEEYARIPTVYDELVEAPEDPVKEGHTFTGWDPFVGTMDEEGKIYNAVFEITEYTVTWVVLDEEYDVFEIPYGGDMEYTAEPDVDGYDFLGWSEDPDADAAGTVLDKMPARDVTYYAVLDAKEYTITFTETGDSTIEPITQDFGTEIDAPEDPVKEGYVFKGWADEDGNIVDVPATMPSNNVVLEATWEKDKFTVTWVYDDDGITADYVVELEYEAAIVPPADPTTKVGHTFKEWSPAVQATMPAMDLTYTAVWTVDSHDAIFNADGGKFADGAETNTVPTNYGEQIVAPADPTKTGYVFAGWDNPVGEMGTEDQSFTAKWDAAKDTPYTVKYFTMDTKGDYDLANPVVVNRTGTTGAEVEAAVTLTEGFYLDTDKSVVKSTIAPDGSTVLEVYYARELYTVTFDANGGVLAGAAASAEYYYGASVEVPTASLEGYEFKGWDKNVSTTAVANADYVAQWTAKQYTITFDTLGGTAIDSITADYKSTVNAPAAVTTKTGYTFIGWSETAGDTTEVTFPVTMPIDGDTYYAIWDANEYTITFDTVGGSTVPAITQDFDTPITAPADPEKEGHTFDNWDVAIPEKMPAENMTITAQWIVNKYDITFDVDGVKQTENVEFGSEIVVPDAPVKDGYTFTGWADADGKTPADYVTVPSTDVEFVAQWDANEYTITFDTVGGTPAIDDIKADFEQPITAPTTVPAKQGYEFGGWVDENGNPAVVPSTMPLNGMKLTAKWNPNTDTPFKVVVNYTDVTTGEAVAQEYPDYTGTTDNAIAIVESIPEPATANTEYVLLGDFEIEHYELDETAENQFTGVVAADGSTVLNLYYVPVKYTATFDAAGGAWKNTDTSREVEIGYGQLVKPLAPAEEPVREGYKFDGWNGLYDSTTLVGDRSFNAKWVENDYTITYIVDGAETSETYKYNALINKPVDPSKEGYKFEGWTPAIPDNMPANDVTVEATWSILSYTVTWNVDGAETTDTFVYDSKIYAPQDPAKTGYTFTGWKDAEGNDLPADMPAENITVYAQWAVNPYTVNYFVYEPATGKFVAAGSESVEYNKAIPTDVPASYTAPAGYSLVAQAYTDIALATPLAAGTLMPAETVNLYYTLKANKYDAVFTVDGTTVATVPTEYGKEIDAPADPAKEGYTFTGWSPEVGTMDDVNGKTFVAQFEEKTYNAIFKANGGLFTLENNEKETTVTVPTKFGAAIEAPAAPAKEGYEFLGWATTATATEAGTIAATMPANDVTYYAVYKVKQYKITFNTDGGTAVGPIIENFGTAITAPEAPKKNGFTFSGWDALPTTMPAKDTTVNAIWTRNNYTVTWKVDNNIVKSESLAFEAAIVAPADPVKDGYKFAGWTPTPVATMPAQNLEYSASWTVENYTATFDANGGKYADNSTTKTQKFDFGAPVTAPEVPTQTGYTFAGWEPALGTMPAADTTYKAVWSAGEEKTYTINVYTMDTKGNYGEPTAETKTAKVGEKVEVTATPTEGFYLDKTQVNVLEDIIKADAETVLVVYYARNEYTIAFNGNGGTVDGEEEVSDTYYHGTTVVAPVTVREGYSLIGWEPELSTVAVADASYTAQWEINEYTVSFDTDGGIPMLPITQDFGTDIQNPGTPVKEGYVFTGWVDADGEPADVPAKMPAEDTALKATWAKAKFTVTFYTDEKMTEVHQQTENDFGAEYIAPAQPTKTGYTFQGWVNDATGKVESFTAPVATPASDVNYYASWEINTNKVVYRTYNGLYKEYIVEFGTPKANIPVPEVDPTQPGHTFTGWSPELPETMPDRQLTILAEWEANTYKANFYKNIGDTDVYEDADVIYGEAIVAPEEEPTMPGYVFEGWSTDGENVIDDLGTIGAENADFYAVWSEATNVEYKVEHYYMDVNKNYPDTATRVDEFNNGTTNETVTATPDNDKNFSVDNGKSVLSGVVAADGSLVLKVYYIREINTLTITVDGVETEKEYPFEAPVDPVDDPEKEGHKFAGWVDENGNPVKVPATMPEDDVTIQATWTVESYDVTYISDDATYYGPTATEYGKTIYVPADPVKEGYEFLGWYTADRKTPADFTAMPASALEFTAEWKANGNISYILEVYEMDFEGEYSDTPTETIKYDDGVVDTEKTAAYTAPTGFTLDTEKSVLTGTVPATGTLVLKAYLIRDKYTLTVVVDGETREEIEYFYNETVDAVDEPTKEGYVFTGWDPKVPVVMPAEDVTVNATWKEDVFTAIFNAGEGKFESTGETTEGVDVAFGSPITAPAEEPVREGYEFGGWATPDDPETKVTDFDNMDADGAEFVAIWVKTDFTVTFYDYRAPSDGVVAPTEKYEYASSTKQFGDTVAIPADPSFKYYKFLGWSQVEGDSTNLITSADTVTMPSEDLTFYAVYEKVPVYLIPKNDTCTTVIDRAGGEYTDYDPATSEWYVYGLEEYITETILLDSYIDVTGDGRIEIVYETNGLGGTWAPYTGTGTIINVYDRLGTVETTDDILVESFRIIIFGDLDGDASVQAIDERYAREEVAGKTHWSNPFAPAEEYKPYLLKAGDISGDGTIEGDDATYIGDHTLQSIVVIDQVTGRIM